MSTSEGAQRSGSAAQAGGTIAEHPAPSREWAAAAQARSGTDLNSIQGRSTVDLGSSWGRSEDPRR